MNIREVMTDPALFGHQFGGPSWKPWRTLLAGFYGLPLDDEEQELFKALTQRESVSDVPHDEMWMAIGRRGGKSFTAALVAVFEAAFRDFPDLAPGEVATVMCLAADRRQSRTIMRYVSGLLHSNAMLEQMIVREDRESIELSNRATIEVGTASFRAVRGYTVACVIADEIAFWRSEESANPDREILNALRPALATLGGKMLCLSSPYAKRGALWEAYRRYFGRPGPVLVAQAPSRVMNPLLTERIVREAEEHDPEAAMAEWHAEFRNDLEQFITIEQLERLTRSEPLTLPPAPGTRYHAFTDPSGGGADGFGLCIAHREQSGRIVVDLLTERVRSNPASVAEEYARILKQYGLREVKGDRYGAQWTVDGFRKFGIHYKPATKNRSELYQEFLVAANSGQIELPPDDKLLRQFVGLERRTGSTGKDVIDHPRGCHDDLANCVAGVAAEIYERPCMKLNMEMAY